MKTIKVMTAIGSVALLAACAGPMPVAHTPKYAPVIPVPKDKAAMPTGAIFATSSADIWQAKRREYQVGDIITVLLNESTQAARTLNNETSRESSNDVIPAGTTSKSAVAVTLFAGADDEKKRKLDALRAKVKVVARMNRIFKTIKTNQEEIVQIKAQLPEGKLPMGMLMGGYDAIHSEWAKFHSARIKNEKSEAFPINSRRISSKTKKLNGSEQ